MVFIAPAPVTVKVLAITRGVDVMISPSLQHGWTGENLVYNVKVWNKGNAADNFILNLSEALGWPYGWVGGPVDNTGEIAAGDNWDNQIWVVVSSPPCTTDSLILTATSTGDNTVKDSTTCQAHAAAAGMDVFITPPHKEAYPGDITFMVTVTNTGDEWDNYTLENSDNSGWPLSLDAVMLGPVPAGENMQTTLHVTLGDNVPVCTTDNITVKATSCHDNTVSDNATCTIHCAIVHGVQVRIEPSENSAGPGENVTFRVTVMNTGGVTDNYVLTKSDNAGWGPTLSENFLANVENGENRAVTLAVTIPDNARGCTRDNVTVTATSQADNTVKDNDSCIAHAENIRGVDVSISPSYKENLPGENLIYTVTVRNTGNIADTYRLENSDNVGWPLKLENTSLAIPPFENRTTNLTVTIPENAPLCTNDNIRVVATSQENENVRADNKCIAHAAIVRRVDVSISPSYENGLPGQMLAYTVKVTNEGNVADNYDLRPSDNAGWGPSLSRNLLENVSPRENRTVTLTVTIPENARPDIKDNITVTAASHENENVSDNASCIAHSLAISRGVKVSISPSEGEGMPGNELSYTIGVMNTGNNADNYDLTIIDSLGWSLSLADNSLENVAPDENRTTTLTVVIYENARPDTEDNITATATSQENAAVSDSASCLARALTFRRVEIMISPGYRNGPPGATLNYTVRVTNTGWATDNYGLVVSGAAGWVASIDPDSLALEPGESGEAVLSVTVPPGVEGSSMIFYVWAISSVDSTVRADATCRALALEIGEGGKLSIPWVHIIIIAAMIAGAVFAVGYVTRRRGRGEKARRHLEEVSAWPLMR